MSTSYSGEKIINRQRVCLKCKGYVTHDKIADEQFACVLCGHKIGSSPLLAVRVSSLTIARIVAAQHREKLATLLKESEPGR